MSPESSKVKQKASRTIYLSARWRHEVIKLALHLAPDSPTSDHNPRMAVQLFNQIYDYFIARLNMLTNSIDR